MNPQKLYAVTALFDTPDQIIAAAEKVSGAGYKEFDVNTPYPVHGMDNAMKLKPSRLGYITLAAGLSGAAFALLFMFWALSIDYPMIIGGKPFFALPAFIPITFEVTVLLATLSTVIGMLTFFFKFPDNNHPIHDTDYMKSVSLDKFGICILASDKNFEEADAKELLSGAGGKNITAIYYPEKEVFAIFQPRFILFLIATALVVSATTYVTLNKLLYIVPFDWMMLQDKTTPQEKSDYYTDGFGMRQPVKGTVARGFMPYPYIDEKVPTETLTNPLLPTREVLELGQKKFLTFCSPCHGNYADGDSRLRGQFPNPPTLHTSRVREMTDGMIYHIITVGQNAMPSYSSQVTREERWAVVNYIRVLQRARNAKDTDLQAVKEEGNKNAKQ